MPYIGQPPVTGDTTKSFRLLDNLASFTLTFDATSSSVVDTSANTLTFANHRFVTAQRVTYTDGGGTAIGGLTDGTAYFIIKVDQNTIQLASSASNANNSTAISLSSGAAGGSHTLNLAFDGTNTKFKATYGNGTKAKISRAGQLLISINGVLQQAQESTSPTLGFGLDSDSTIVFSQAPVSTDVLFGQILADTITNFDTQDNTLDVFTGDGSTTDFTLSKKPASSNDILVTLDGVVQYPTTTSTSNAYSVSDNTLSFTSAPADGVAIQVRHIGFAGATSSAVTGLYGRTGNVTLSSSDDDITVGNVTAGIITATSYGSISGTTASFSGNVSIGGTLTYEDVTNIDAVGLITARNGIKVDDLGVQVGTGATVDSAGDNILTFLTNGSERVRITSAGNVGINTDNPGAPLVVRGGSASNPTIRVEGGSTGNDNARIESKYNLVLACNGDGDQSDRKIQFRNNATTLTTIDSDGRLLLGTTTEGAAQSDDLTVATSGNTGITIRSGTSSNGNLFFSDGTSGTDEYRGYVQYDHSANELIFGSDATARMRIDSSGVIRSIGNTSGTYENLLLTDGTSNSTTKRFGINCVHYNTAEEDFTIIHGASSSSENVIKIGGNNSATTTNDATNIRFYTAANQTTTSSSERMRIDSSGNVGIGENAPLGNLHVKSGDSGASSVGSAADELVLENSTDSGMTFLSGTSGFASINFADSGDANVGQILYSHGSNYLAIKTNDSERMRIDSSGRLLLNHNSSINNAGVASQQQITGDSAATASLSIRRDANSTSGPLLIFGKSRSGALGNNVSVAQNDNIGSIVFAAADGTDVSSQCAEIKAQIDGTPGSNDTPGRLIFMTASDGSNAPTERMRITSEGYVRIGSTAGGTQPLCIAKGDSAGVNLQFQNSTSGNNSNDGVLIGLSGGEDGQFWNYENNNLLFGTNNIERMRLGSDGTLNVFSYTSTVRSRNSNAASTSHYLYLGYHSATTDLNGTYTYGVFTNGNVVNTNNSYGAISDAKLKENIVDASSQWDDIKDLRVRNYNFIEGQTHTQLGVVAQEVETVSPGLVTDSPDLDEEGNDLGTVTKSVNYSVLYMKAVKALQEAQTRIESLEARLDAGGL
jgi:hypothetical protein